MKTSLIIATLLIAFSACTKQASDAAPKHEKAYYRVSAIGIDTAYTPWMYGRAVTPVKIAEDDYLRVEFIGYTGGQYLVQVTNKQKCDADFLIGYETVKPTGISPNRKNSLTENQVKSKKTEVFYISAPGVIGKIKIKARSICNYSCDPEWLTIDVTSAAMAVKYSQHELEYRDGAVIISWVVENPDEADKYIIEKLFEGTTTVINSIKSDKVTKSHKVMIWD